MIVELVRYQSKIVWECENGGQVWGSSPETGTPSSSTMPNSLCAPGWQSIFTLFIVGLSVDLVFQVSTFSIESARKRES